MAFHSDELPWLAKVRQSYYPGVEAHGVDPDSPPEAHMSGWADDGLDGLRDDVDRALAVMERGDDVHAGDYLGMFSGLPAGGTWVGWLRYLTEHLEEFWPRRRPQTINSDGKRTPRESVFADKASGDAAATAVVRAHADALRAWAADPLGTDRLHLYADLGRPVGTYLLRGEIEARELSRDDAAPPPVRRIATGCVVVMARTPDTREAFIAAAYPELALPTAARERFPDLPSFFGGWFGQDYAELDGTRWAAERGFNTRTAPHVRDRVADQLEQLLAADDEALRRDVEALGSYVLPVAARRWVTGLHRRMTRLDWTPAPQAVR